MLQTHPSSDISISARAFLAASIAAYKPGQSVKDIRIALEKFRKRLADDVADQFGPAITHLAKLPDVELAAETAILAQKTLTEALSVLVIQHDGLAAAKSRGAIFTPPWLANRIASLAARYWRQLHPDGRKPNTIGDLSCGAGALLLAASSSFDGSGNYYGADIDKRSLSFAALLAAANNQRWKLSEVDSLGVFRKQRGMFMPAALPETFDVLIGNPPYVRSASMHPAYSDELRSSFSTLSHGNFDLSVAFVESALEALSEGGVFSYVLSSKFSQSNYGRALCKKLSTDAQVMNVEFFGDNQLFEGYTTYVMILTAAKLPPAKRFSLTTVASLSKNDRDSVSGSEITVSTEKLGSVPWDFTTGKVETVLSKFHNPNNQFLTNVFGGIFQGIRTGANDVYVLSGKQISEIESEILLPFVSGRQIKSFQIKSDELKVIFPYKVNEFGDVSSLSEDGFKRKFPTAWRRLAKSKPLLELRSRDSGSAWFAYSRSQNLNGYLRPKLFVKEMMARAEFAADFKGEISFGSGYALDASKLSKSDLQLWTAVLNTRTMEFQLRNLGTQLHSGWFRLLKHHLKRARLPTIIPNSLSRAYEIAKRLHERDNKKEKEKALLELDQIVSISFGLDAEEREVVREFLASAHAKSLKVQAPQESEPDVEIEHGEVNSRFEPVVLKKYNKLHIDRPDLRGDVTFRHNKNAPIHRWYPYTQGYSVTLVEKLINHLNISSGQTVLDPFAGCGTTLLTCKQQAVNSIGFDVSPLMAWVTQTKVAQYDLEILKRSVKEFPFDRINKIAKGRFEKPTLFESYFDQAYSERVLRKLGAISTEIGRSSLQARTKDFLLLGLVSLLEVASNLRKHGSHYRFLNKQSSVGLQKLNIPTVSEDVDIAEMYRQQLLKMLSDVEAEKSIGTDDTRAVARVGDARSLAVPSASVDFVITSPPYLNRNNYIAQQKAELFFLGMVDSYASYKSLVRSTFRSHTDADLSIDLKSSIPEVNAIISNIELVEGNNPKIPQMIVGYFADLSATIRELARVVRPGGAIAFVVGNTRWGGVVIPIDHLLLAIGERSGFRAEQVLVSRLKGNSPQQMKQFGRIAVRESVVILRRT